MVGERAVEIVQVVAIAMAAGMRVDALAQVPLSYPTYAGILGRVAYRAAEQLNLKWAGGSPRRSPGGTPGRRRATRSAVLVVPEGTSLG